MRTKALIFALSLLVIHVTAKENPAHDYAVVDVNNGLILTLVSVGTTSFTLRVEWSLDLEIPENSLDLMGRFEQDGVWENLAFLGVEQTKGGITCELLYDHLTWSNFEDTKAQLAEKAFFCVEIPDPEYTGIEWIEAERRAEKEAERKRNGIEEKKPARDYIMVDIVNGLIPTLLDIGTTSLTFRVEWPLSLEISEHCFDLMGKFELERSWVSLMILDVDQTKGESTYEILYESLPWSRWANSKKIFEENAFFCVAIPGLDYMGEDWVIEEIRARKEAAEKRKEKDDQTSAPNQSDESEPENKTNRLWLPAGILISLCVVFYFMRKKRQ